MKMFHRKFQFRKDRLQYDFKLRRPFPWWILLLLLPLLLLIPIDKEVRVVVLDQEGKTVPGATVEMSYTDHALFRQGIFFRKTEFAKKKVSDASGEVDFGKVQGSVFGFIFHHCTKISLTAQSGVRRGENAVRYYSLYRNPIPVTLNNGIICFQVLRKDTEEPLEGASLDVAIKGGRKLSLKTDSEGKASFESEKGEEAIDRVLASCTGFVDSEEKDIRIDGTLPEVIKIWMYYKVDNVDIALCIDGTGSMRGTLEAVKRGSRNIYGVLKERSRNHGKLIESMRLRIVYFGDFRADGDMALVTSRFYTVPGEESQYRKEVDRLRLCGGGDEPESGLEALAVAMNSEWATTPGRNRRLVAVWSDASAHPVHTVGLENPKYPKDIPTSFSGLSQKWKEISFDASGERFTRLLLVTPLQDPWGQIVKEWDGVIHDSFISSTAGDVDAMMEIIAKSL